MTAISLWPGTIGPTAGTPRRTPGSVRRTSTVDAQRPHGLDGPLVLVGRARDLRTTSAAMIPGSVISSGDTVRAPDAAVVAEASSRITLDYLGGRLVTEIVCDPPVTGIQGLVGTRASSGFRTALDQTAGHLTAQGTPLGLLLDEVPVVTLISGTAVARANGQRPKNATMPPVNVCSGWVAGGEMDVSNREGRFTLVGSGPAAPPLEDDSDPLGWHETPPPAPVSIRRRRRIDVAPGARPDEVTVDGIFRDTYCDPDGVEWIIHEYAVAATVDRATGMVRSAGAIPHVLPGPDCPTAAASAGRLVGHHLAGLRDILRADLVGPTTCTHLTDQLRALADVHALLPLLD